MFVDQLTEELALRWKPCEHERRLGPEVYIRVLLCGLEGELEGHTSTDLDTHRALLHGGRKLDIIPSNAWNGIEHEPSATDSQK